MLSTQLQHQMQFSSPSLTTAKYGMAYNRPGKEAAAGAKEEESFRRSKKSGIHSHKLVHAFSTHYEKKSDGGARTLT